MHWFSGNVVLVAMCIGLVVITEGEVYFLLCMIKTLADMRRRTSIIDIVCHSATRL